MKKASTRDIFFYIILVVIVIVAFVVLSDMQKTAQPYYSEVRSLIEQEAVREISYTKDTLTLVLREPYNGEMTLTYTMYDFDLFYSDFNDLVVEQYHRGIIERYDYPAPNTTSIWALILPNLILVGVFALMMFLMLGRAAGAGGEGGARGAAAPDFTRSKAKDGTVEGKKKTFNDVAGAEEEKAELQEIVEFLKDPTRFVALGARIPKGVLLVGPPGTGKTLLAKAVAGEAGVQFRTISGSDFVELYVGVGASRVRDLFAEAKANAPCIIFIDEIDAVGRQRGTGLGGGHDEREQTLNQLLVEMDGFGSNEGVIVLAATNRQDILDPAILRPGRFDRQVYVGAPDVKGREDILKIHSRGKPLADDVSLQGVARATSGFTGADLENLMNEAALLSARRNKKVISKLELDEAILKVLAGPEKRSRLISDKEKRLVAYHEAGHAVAAHALALHDPVHHITIISRGGAGGMTIYRPDEDKNFVTKQELRQRIISALGGRAAEELVLDDISAGASSDLQQVSSIARNMVTRYGMSDKVGQIAFESSSGSEIFIGRSMAQQRSYSEEMASLIDHEVKDLIDEAYVQCLNILRDNRKKLDAVANYLLEHETMSAEEFKAIMQA